MNEGASGKPPAIKRLLAPLSILALSAAIFFVLVKNEPTLKTTVKEPIPVAVRALNISLEPIQLSSATARVSKDDNWTSGFKGAFDGPELL